MIWITYLPHLAVLALIFRVGLATVRVGRELEAQEAYNARAGFNQRLNRGARS